MKECPECGRCEDDQLRDCPEDGSLLQAALSGPRLIDNRYLLLRCLGKGGMGSVYLAQHIELQKNFALKLILHSVLSDPHSLVRFRNEAKVLGRLQHPNIVQVTDYGIDDRDGGLPYLVMEHLKGRTLRYFLSEHGPLDIGHALPLLESIASALDYAHACGILHRDLNPKNVFLVQEGDVETRVKILDFGLARLAGNRQVRREGPSSESVSGPPPVTSTDVTRTIGPEEISGGLQKFPPGSGERLTQVGFIMGTPGYIAPEVLQGFGAATASDIYSFGILMYETLAGKRPDLAISPTSEHSSIPKEIEQALFQPLHNEPGKRPTKAMDALRHLEKAHARHQYGLWKHTEWPKRIGLAAGLTLMLVLLFFLLKGFPLLVNLENFLVDLRFRAVPWHPPAESIVLVSIDEATLDADPAHLVNKADEMGIFLQSVVEAGARGIVLDFLLPESWGRSESFAKLILNNQDKVILASYIKEDGQLLGTECLRGLIMAALGSEVRAGALFGFLNMRPDPDGRIRRAQPGYQVRDEQTLLSLPSKAFRLATGSELTGKLIEQPLWIDFSADWTKFQKISWKDLRDTLGERPDAFNQKMVLVGGDYEASQDFHRIPQRRGAQGELSGLLIQALTLNTWLQGRPIQEVNRILALLPAVLIFLVFSTILLVRLKVIWPTIVLLVLLTGYGFWSFLLFLRSRQLVFFGTPLLLCFLATIAIFFIRRRLTFLEKPAAQGRQ